MDKKVFDVFEENFPEVIVDGKIRVELIKKLIGTGDEYYDFSWTDKRKTALATIKQSDNKLVEYPDEGIDVENTKNLFVEGDNFEALKLLKDRYHNKVKLIYIDPPYNTGKAFVYDDKFYNRNNHTHISWCNFIYGRLLMARDYLRDDGVICISINDREYANLKKIGDQVFDEENFIGTFIYKTRNGAGGTPTKTMLVPTHDYVLCFAKNIDKFQFRGSERTDEGFINPDNDPRGDYRRGQIKYRSNDRRDNRYDIVNPRTGKSWNQNWAYSPKKVNELIADNRIIFPDDENGVGLPKVKKFRDSFVNDTKCLGTYLGDHHTARETISLIKMMDGDNIFDYPKPLSMLEYLIHQCMDDNDTMMDFFVGSGSSAHALMNVNREHGGNRNFVVVQLPEVINDPIMVEKYGHIANATKERLRKSIGKIKTEYPDSKFDLGFNVMKIEKDTE